MGMIQFSLSNRANQSEFCMDFACIYPISSFFYRQQIDYNFPIKIIFLQFSSANLSTYF